MLPAHKLFILQKQMIAGQTLNFQKGIHHGQGGLNCYVPIVFYIMSATRFVDWYNEAWFKVLRISSVLGKSIEVNA